MGTNFPKLNLLYYKHILDSSFGIFVKGTGSFFTNENGLYVLAKNISRNKIKISLRKIIISEIMKYVEKFDIMNPNYYIIIGSCIPKNNILWNLRKDYDIPEKLIRIVNSEDYDIKYFLKEGDVKVDIDSFNVIFEEIFDEMFCSNGIRKWFGKEYGNLMFIREKTLDCYMMYKIIRSLYGKVNVINIHREKKLGEDRSIYSVNEFIDMYIHGKRELLKSDKMDIIKKEIRQYIDGFLFK